MAQQDIIDLLKKEKRWMCANEISNIIGIRDTTCQVNLRKLKKCEEIEYKEKEGFTWNNTLKKYHVYKYKG